MERRADCPSCGRFIGAKERCPYCGAIATDRLSTKLTKVLSIIGAVLGLALLYVASNLNRVPDIRIGDITPEMDLATVKISGVVTRERLKRPGYLSFSLSDNTGEISAKAYGSVADNIYPSPRDGDSIELVAVIRGVDHPPSIIAHSADRVWVRTQIGIRDINTISEADLGSIVRISGWVKSFRPLRRGTVIQIGDRTGVIETVLWGEKPGLWRGKAIDCVGRVSLFRNNLQIEIMERRL